LNHWPFWVSGLALASVMLIHWFSTGRMMAVSGRFSALVNRLRYGDADDSAEEAAATPDDLLAAIRAMTAETFGDAALEDPAGGAAATPQSIPAAPEPTPALAPQPPWLHLVFFSALVLGGLLSALAWGTLSPGWGLRGTGFSSTFGEGPGSSAVLLFGGVLTGFGTRMAGGCTSGHGLCGVSRLQPGSLLATAAFFGAGILMSLALETL
jgi:uncharacterized membrane protein YedE/YeeE